MNATVTRVTETEIVLRCKKIGHVKLSKFSPSFDNGLYRARPWHVVTFGRNYATVEECLMFLERVESIWEQEDGDDLSYRAGGECEAAYLRVE